MEMLSLTDFVKEEEVNLDSPLERILAMDYIALVAAVSAIRGYVTPVTLDWLWRETGSVALLSCEHGETGFFAHFFAEVDDEAPHTKLRYRNNYYYKLPADFLCALRRVVYRGVEPYPVLVTGDVS